MSVFIIIALIILVFIIIYQIGKASEYAVVLRGEEKVKSQTNRAIAFSAGSHVHTGHVGHMGV